jgi:hypothetical protein
MRDVFGIVDGILLSNVATEATSTQNELGLCAYKVLSNTLNIFDNLLERIRNRSRALSMASEVEREDSVFVGKT